MRRPQHFAAALAVPPVVPARQGPAPAAAADAPPAAPAPTGRPTRHGRTSPPIRLTTRLKATPGKPRKRRLTCTPAATCRTPSGPPPTGPAPGPPPGRARHRHRTHRRRPVLLPCPARRRGPRMPAAQRLRAQRLRAQRLRVRQLTAPQVRVREDWVRQVSDPRFPVHRHQRQEPEGPLQRRLPLQHLPHRRATTRTSRSAATRSCLMKQLSAVAAPPCVEAGQ